MVTSEATHHLHEERMTDSVTCDLQDGVSNENAVWVDQSAEYWVSGDVISTIVFL